ncbi:hypothetical protein DFJ73DRAFT_779101 [Zopfochytrium polystomum]|nr:hypothetical protein DFJ73DRAFT_779101 [Zopfochytrium polystomum]
MDYIAPRGVVAEPAAESQVIEAMGDSDISSSDLQAPGASFVRKSSFKKPKSARKLSTSSVRSRAGSVHENDGDDGGALAAPTGDRDRDLSPVYTSPRSLDRNKSLDRNRSFGRGIGESDDGSDESQARRIATRYLDTTTSVDELKRMDDVQSMTIQQLRDEVISLRKQLARKDKDLQETARRIVELDKGITRLQEAEKLRAGKDSGSGEPGVLAETPAYGCRGKKRLWPKKFQEVETAKAAANQKENTLVIMIRSLKEQLSQVEELRSEVETLTEQNNTLKIEREGFAWLQSAGSGSSGGGGAEDQQINPALVAPRTSSAIDLVDTLPEGGDLKVQIMKSKIAALKESELKRLRAENIALVNELAATLNNIANMR